MLKEKFRKSFIPQMTRSSSIIIFFFHLENELGFAELAISVKLFGRAGSHWGFPAQVPVPVPAVHPGTGGSGACPGPAPPGCSSC